MATKKTTGTSASKLKWVDETSHRRDDPPDKLPETLVANLCKGRVKLVVTRHIHLAKNQWLLRCDALGIEQVTDFMCSLATAQQTLYNLVVEKLQDIAMELGWEMNYVG